MGSCKVGERRSTGSVEPYVHPPTMRQFLDPLNSVVERVPRVHLVSPVLVHPNETIEVRNLSSPMSHKGAPKAVGQSNPPRVPSPLVATALHP